MPLSEHADIRHAGLSPGFSPGLGGNKRTDRTAHLKLASSERAPGAAYSTFRASIARAATSQKYCTPNGMMASLN